MVSSALRNRSSACEQLEISVDHRNTELSDWAQRRTCAGARIPAVQLECARAHLPLLGKVKAIEIRRRTQLIEHLLVIRRKRSRGQQVQISPCKGQLRGKCAMMLLRLCREDAGGACRVLERDVRRAQLEKIDGRRFRKILLSRKRSGDNRIGWRLSRSRSGQPWRNESLNVASAAGINEDSDGGARSNANPPGAPQNGGCRLCYGGPQ